MRKRKISFMQKVINTDDLIKEIAELKKKNAELIASKENLQQQNNDYETALAYTANELYTSENQFRLMADSIPVIVWTADANGDVDFFNQRWYDFTGQTENMSHGWGWQPVLHADDLQRTLEAWNNALLTGAMYEIEYRFKNKDNDAYRWFLGNGLPLRDKQGTILKWFGTCTDIQEQKDAVSKKDEFISIASHELKTPLTTVKAFVQIAKKVLPAGTAASGFMSKASVQLERLEKLISDLLDVSKINAGKMMYELEEFNFSEALRETVESVQQASAQHSLVLETPDNIIIKGDRLRLEQVINNLLTNAIKYSPEAKEVIVQSQVQQNNLIVSVQDFGVGIAPENIKNLFDRYYRVDNTAMRFQGLGLGLFISSEIIKRHNGSFWLESEEGKGSTFYFLLPLGGESSYKNTITDNSTYYKSNFISVQYNAANHWLEVDWLGYQNFDSVKQGCLIMLDLLKKNNCTQVLNDNTHVAGNWSEASDWVAEVWFPAMQIAGLRQFAWIYSPSTFSRLAANKSVEENNNGFTCFFSNKPEAMQWLTAMKGENNLAQ